MPWKYASSGLVLAVALLAGCSSTSESTPPSQSTSAGDTGHSRCDAAAAQFVIGKPASAALLEQARVKAGDTGHSRCDAAAAQFVIGKPASAALLEQARVKAGAQTARVLGPNDMVTLEYRSDRLNLNTDQSATINRVNCG